MRPPRSLIPPQQLRFHTLFFRKHPPSPPARRLFNHQSPQEWSVSQTHPSIRCFLLSSNIPLSFQADTGLPAGWEVRHSNSKNLPYYFNSNDKVSRWEPPAGTDTEKLKHYMAAHHSAGSRPGAAPGVPEGKIRAAHLLVKHRDSRRPSSWREVRLSPSPPLPPSSPRNRIDRDPNDAYLLCIWKECKEGTCG